MRDDNSKSILFPVAGLVSILIGFFIVNSDLNVHSGEIILFAFAAFGLMLAFPILMFVKSMGILRKKSFAAATNRKTSLYLTVTLGVVWASMIILVVVLEG